MLYRATEFKLNSPFFGYGEKNSTEVDHLKNPWLSMAKGHRRKLLLLARARAGTSFMDCGSRGRDGHVLMVFQWDIHKDIMWYIR